MNNLYSYRILSITLFLVYIYCSGKEMLIGPSSTATTTTTTTTTTSTSSSTTTATATITFTSGHIENGSKCETSAVEEISGRLNLPKTSICPQDKQDNVVQPDLQRSSKNSIQIETDQTKSCEKVFMLRDRNDDQLIVETAECEKLQDHELIGFFEGLDDKLKKVTKFYHYYDVLSFIDKIIGFIYEFLVIPNNNISRNAMIIRRTNRNVYPDFSKIQHVLDNINKILGKKNNQDLSKYSCVKNEINTIEKQDKSLKGRYNFERDKKIQFEYYLDNPKKYKELTQLQNDLNEIRTNLFPMDETTIEKYADFFKNECLKILSEVHENLINCFEEENKSLDWLFEILNGIMNDTKALIEKLSLHDEFIRKNETTKR